MPKSTTLACLLAAAALLAGCQKDYTAYALTSTGSIIKFNTKKPGTIDNTVTITGLDSSQSVVQLAYRPSGGTTGTASTLYCITNDGFLCTVDPEGGTASLVGTIAFTDTLGSGGNSVRLATPVISFDPVADQLRVISSDYNLRVDPGTGQLLKQATKIAFDSNDSNNGKTPQLAGMVYDNPVAGATSTTLFALDSTTGSLLRIGDENVSTVDSADGGDLRTVGTTNVDFRNNGGFAIEQKNGDVYAVLQQSGAGAALYTVDLSGGGATEVGSIGDGNQTLDALVILPGN